MSGTRPIPINHSRDSSRRASPTSSTASRDLSSPPTISQSCPVNGRHMYHPHQQPPPRAPIIGSLPEPSMMHLNNPMPELVLPPPAQHREQQPSPRVVQFASSCPVEIGFLRDGNPTQQQRSWAPSPRTLDEFDLSKSPALAVMSAMRDGRAPSNASAQSSTSRPSRQFFPPETRQIPEESEDEEANDVTRRTADNRRGSYSSVTGDMENLDLGGVFHFDEEH